MIAGESWICSSGISGSRTAGNGVSRNYLQKQYWDCGRPDTGSGRLQTEETSCVTKSGSETPQTGIRAGRVICTWTPPQN